jgi:succinyl-diaminopimelate desuccinylase
VATSAADREAVVALTQALIRIPSVHRPGEPGGDETQAAAFVSERLRELGFEVHLEEVAPGRPNVIGVLDTGRPGRTLMLEAHTDVVTPGERERWTRDPFGGELAEGRLHGRGALDTKGNLAAALVAVGSLLREGGLPGGRLIFASPCDEEGLMLGVKHLIERGWARGVEGALICEPEENQVCWIQKGALRVVIRTLGRMAHGAMPRAGVNPIPRMARVLAGIERLERRERERVGRNPELGWPSITPTILQAPERGDPQLNVMPDRCLCALDIRTVPGQEHPALLAALRAVLDEAGVDDPDFRAEMEVLDDRPWTVTPRDHPLVMAVAEAVREVTGREPVYNGVPGATDGTFLHLAGVPIVTTGAGERELPHQADESVAVDELATTVAIYRSAIRRFLAGGELPHPPERRG